MFSTLRTRFGIPGVISVMALVFAMFGGAYAASNSSDGGKATASAKGKKGPRGPKGATGPAGPAGPQGPAGANGKDGANGSNGAPGAAGKSVIVGNATGVQCENGGKTLEVEGSGAKSPVCNGANGNPWTAGGTLPPGATETGTWSVTAPRKEAATALRVYASISFPIQLEESLDGDHVHYLETTDPPTADCPGSRLEPAAADGHLCIYAHLSPSQLMPGEGIAMPDFSALGAGPSGAILQFEPETGEPTYGFGSWAVTAP